MAINLDDLAVRQQYDPDGMLARTEDMTAQCKHGEQLAREFDAPKAEGVENVVICGMGGSAIGGDLLKACVGDRVKVPVEICRNYSLPGYVGEKTLVIAGSYSGNTEETLSAYGEAKSRKAAITAITTGGKLAEQCEADGYKWLRIPSGFQPRAATGYSFMPLLVLFERWGLIGPQADAIAALYETLDATIAQNQYAAPAATNPSKQLAHKLHGKLPIIYAGQDAFYPIAARWRGQFNENSKHFAHDSVLPEMNHNEILGWKNPEAILKQTHIVYLLDSGYHPQTQKRFAIMKNVVRDLAGEVSEVYSSGNGLLARMFSVINFGDFVSIYLAFLNEQDPTPIPAINYLKTELSK